MWFGFSKATLPLVLSGVARVGDSTVCLKSASMVFVSS
jgi:hypothetical protein